MSVVTLAPSAASRFAVPPEPVLPLTVAQYHAMIRAGALEGGAPIELLEGWLVSKMIKNPSHRVAVRKCRIALERILPAAWSVDTQEPVTTAESEPEPDISVVRGDTTTLLDRHPGPNEIGLLVEVAETSLERDRGWKKRIYAAAGIPVYWIVNLVDRQIEVFTQPSGPGERPDYGTRQIFLAGDELAVVLDGSEMGRIAVHELLP
ncbi:MAG: Uma2 family endonuclease [Planctomycetota bacterium]|nr:Uma2 family endonuclease [Planctomycetota bacterium]